MKAILPKNGMSFMFDDVEHIIQKIYLQKKEALVSFCTDGEIKTKTMPLSQIKDLINQTISVQMQDSIKETVIEIKKIKMADGSKYDVSVDDEQKNYLITNIATNTTQTISADQFNILIDTHVFEII